MNLFSGGMPEDLVEEDDYPYAPGYVPPADARRRDADGTWVEFGHYSLPLAFAYNVPDSLQLHVKIFTATVRLSVHFWALLRIDYQLMSGDVDGSLEE